jgi:hypothetical protein
MRTAAGSSPPRVFPSFNLKKFESEAFALAWSWRQSLAGKQQENG